MTLQTWLAAAGSTQIQQQLAADHSRDDFQAIVRLAARRPCLDWDEAVGLLHMVYAWMPTMLRQIKTPTDQRQHLVDHLRRVRDGGQLTTDELDAVQCFANGSIVGASKLLYVLSPGQYVIWDSRVARAFLWPEVTWATYNTAGCYETYLDTVRQWAKETAVVDACAALRDSIPELACAGDLRLIELVLYISAPEKPKKTKKLKKPKKTKKLKTP